MDSIKKTARAAGFFYLLLAITGMFGILYVPSQIFVENDLVATMNNITTQSTLYRVGVVSGLIGQVSFVLVGVLLYRILKPANATHALAMLAFVLTAVPVAFVYAIFELAPFVLLGDDAFLHAFTTAQLHALTMVFVKLRGVGVMVVEIFWGLWLFPLGYVVFHSNLFPRILGVMLMIGSFGYVVVFFFNVLAPSYSGIFSHASFVTTIAEFSFLLYLLIKGVKEDSQKSYSTAI